MFFTGIFSPAHKIFAKLNYVNKIFFYNALTVVMAVLYHKAYWTLKNRNKYLKSSGSNPVRQSSSRTSYRIVNYTKNHGAFPVCFNTVLSCGVGNFPKSVSIVLLIAGEKMN